MRKRLVLTAIVIVSAKMLFAQHSKKHPDLYMGFKAGVNVSALNVRDGVDYTERPSFYAGGLAHLHINKNFAIQHELFFSGQGGKDGDDRLRLAYLNSPLLAQYMTGFGLRFQTGPQLGILLSGREKNGNTETDIKRDLKPVDFSWVFGTSYLFPGTGFGIDARYNLGISNVNDGPAIIQNRVFSAGVFYQFQCKMHDKQRRK